MDFIKSQFIEVIEWMDQTDNTIAYRFPVQGNEIKIGAQLIVRESQVAVFINEGTLIPGAFGNYAPDCSGYHLDFRSQKG
jgi:membrane protease subunit (stomatin/prohibitin family)